MSMLWPTWLATWLTAYNYDPSAFTSVMDETSLCVALKSKFLCCSSTSLSSTMLKFRLFLEIFVFTYFLAPSILFVSWVEPSWLKSYRCTFCNNSFCGCMRRCNAFCCFTCRCFSLHSSWLQTSNFEMVKRISRSIAVRSSFVGSFGGYQLEIRLLCFHLL